MKKLHYLLAFAVIGLAACGGGTKTAEETKEVTEASDSAVTFALDLENTKVNWKGSKVIQPEHMGTVKVSEGSLSLENGNITAGNFVIDMTSITNTDLTDVAENNKLVGHLKSADFFMVDTFPTAKFEVTGCEAITEGGTHKITGNLTIKGITNGISFPATVAVEGDAITAKATFEINRNEWNVVWGGSKESNKGVLGFLGDNLVKDMIQFDIDLKGKK